MPAPADTRIRIPEGVVIQRQLGHADVGITSIYLQGIDSSKTISTVHGRRSPTIFASVSLQMKR